MAKLQKIVRANFSEIYSVNIPKELIEQMEWKKGQDIDIVLGNNLNEDKILVLRSKE